MLTMQGYDTLEQVLDHEEIEVYRVQSVASGQILLAKTVKTQYMGQETVAHFRNEFKQMRILQGKGTIEAIALEVVGERPILLFQNIEGYNLSTLASRDVSLLQKIKLAIALVECVHQLHSANIVLNEILPCYFIVADQMDEVKLIDLRFSYIKDETNSYSVAGRKVSSLYTYTAPEKLEHVAMQETAHMDIYSLGILLYELFTGRAPYTSTQVLDVIYDQVSTVQQPMYVRNEAIPIMLSALVDKCMEKTPSMRYTSAYSLQADLEECYRRFQQEGMIQPFPLATYEVIIHWFEQRMPFGRDKEQQLFTHLLTQIRQGRVGAISVSGEEGVGKTYFVEHTLKKLLLPDDVYVSVLSEKAEQQVPYSLFKKVVEQLVKQILAKPNEQFERWQYQVKATLKGNESLFVSLVPSLSLLIGEHPKQPLSLELEVEEIVHEGITHLLQLFIEDAHLFTLFIDDFHFIDEQSLHLLRYLLQMQSMQRLLVITAYRVHARTLLPATQQTVVTQHIPLRCYTEESFAQFLQFGLGGTQKEQRMLQQILFKKTSGNPLRLRQFLQEALEKGFVEIDFSKDFWQWNLQGIAMLTNRKQQEHPAATFMKYVNHPTAQLLIQAAFLGNQFKLQPLAEMTGYTQQQLLETLQAAMNYQLIYHLSNEQQLYAFQHEDIRQMFEQRVSLREQEMLRIKAGTILLKYLDEDVTVVEVLQHFNQVQEQLIAHGRRLQLIELNFKAAQEVAAHDEAAVYLQTAFDLLLAEDWQQHYALTYAIYKLRAEWAIVSEHYELATALCELLLKQSQTLDDTMQVYVLYVKLALYQDAYDQVFQLGKEALALLQLPIKLEVSKVKEYYYWLRMSRKLGKSPPKALTMLPKMSDVRIKAAMRILVYMANASMVSSREGWLMAVVLLLDLTWQYGVTEESAYGFAGYGLIQNTLAFNYETAYSYGKFASELVQNNAEVAMQVNTIIMLGQDSWRKYEPDFLLSISDYANQHGVLSDSKWQTNHSFLTNCGLLFNFSYPLKDLYAHLLSRSSLLQNDTSRAFAELLSSLLTKLTGYVAAHDPFYTQSQPIEKGTFLYEGSLLFRYITGYLLGDYEEAYEAVVESKEIDQARKKRSLPNGSNDYYYMLITKELFTSATFDKRQTRRCVKNLQRMAKRSPNNYLHKYLAVKAVYAQMRGQAMGKVEELYEQAVQAAYQYGHIHDVGIIAECLAKYHLEMNKKIQAKVYLNESYAAYQRWGALAKVAQLEAQYGHLLFSKKTTDLEQVDYLTIVSSASALSEEIEIEQLLNKLLRIMLQNAGAKYGALLLAQEENWVVEAYGTLENIVVQSIPIREAGDFVPTSIIDYSIKMKQEVVLHDAMNSGFSQSNYIKEHNLRSVLCLPITHQNKLLAILYMENNLSEGVFTEERLDVLKLLCSQCAISITNARLYSDIHYLTKNLEHQVEERTESLQKSMQMTSEALTEMSIYAERNRIAQEIHDIVGHTLTSTILQIEAGRRLLVKDTDAAVQRLKDAQDLVRHSLSEIRNSVHMLREDKYYDVQRALSALIENTERNTGVKIHATIDDVEHLPVIMKKLLYHALQEGLTNGIRHGQSSAFHFTLQDDGEKVQFELLDNGNGAEDLLLGFGLSMMRDRVEQLKGTFLIQSAHGNGCVVHITLPYKGDVE